MNKSIYPLLLEKYLDKSISDDEMDQLQKLLGEYPDLREDFDNHKLAIKAIQSYGFKQELADVMSSRKSRSLRSSSAWLKWAAVIAVLLVSTVVFWPNGQSPDKAYEEYYKPYPNLQVSRNEDPGPLIEGFVQYNSQHYQEAIELILTSEEYTNGDDNAIFYLGQAYQATKDYSNAIANYKRISETSEYYLPARWYQALSTLITDPEASISIFEEVIEAGYNQEEALMILEKIR